MSNGSFKTYNNRNNVSRQIELANVPNLRYIAFNI